MEMFSTLGIDAGMMIAQAINFAILLVVLWRLLYKPALRVIDERRERVRRSMDDAAKIEKQVADMEKDRKKRLKEIDAQSKDLLDEAKKRAEGMKKDILAGAKAEVDLMIEKGRKLLEEERRTLLTDMQKTVTAVSVDLAGRILEREFSDDDQKRLLSRLERDVPSLIK